MAILDHLVPAFGADAYGASLDGLPLGVWLKGGILPESEVYDFLAEGRRPATPDDFRYKVVLSDGKRGLDYFIVSVKRGSNGKINASLSRPSTTSLGRRWYRDFLSGYSVDPKQDWAVDPFGIDLAPLVLRIFAGVAVAGALGVYGLYKIAQRTPAKRGT